jgi:hypothetical protein
LAVKAVIASDVIPTHQNILTDPACAVGVDLLDGATLDFFNDPAVTGEIVAVDQVMGGYGVDGLADLVAVPVIYIVFREAGALTLINRFSPTV